MVSDRDVLYGIITPFKGEHLIIILTNIFLAKSVGLSTSFQKVGELPYILMTLKSDT